MKTVTTVLKLAILFVILAFIVMSVWHYIDFKTHPEKYAIESAPWYTVVLIRGAIAVLLVIALAAAIAILNKKLNK